MMKYLKNMKILLRFSHLMCLFPFHIEIAKNKLAYKLATKSYICRAVIFDLIMVGCMGKHSWDMLQDEATLNEMVMIACSFPIVLAILDLQISGFSNRKRYEKLLNLLYNVENRLGKIGKSEFAKPGCLIIIQPIFTLTAFIYLFTVYYIYYDIIESFVTNLGYTLPKFALLTSTCVYTTFLTVIRRDFRQLNHILATRGHSKALFEIYTNLVAVCKKINFLYGRQCLLTILIYFVWTIYEMYHLVILLSHEDGPKHLILLASSYTMLQEAVLFTILAVCQSTVTEAEQFKAFWYSKLINNYPVGKLETSSLKLLHHTVKFTAMDLYILDLKQFFAMLGALVTLIVILTQFSTSL